MAAPGGRYGGVMSGPGAYTYYCPAPATAPIYYSSNSSNCSKCICDTATRLQDHLSAAEWVWLPIELHQFGLLLAAIYSTRKEINAAPDGSDFVARTISWALHRSILGPYLVHAWSIPGPYYYLVYIHSSYIGHTSVICKVFGDVDNTPF